MSKTQVEYTEDDTFEALRRIPVAELERRLEWQCMCIADMTRRRVNHIQFVNRAERRSAWLSAIIGAPEKVMLTDVELFKSYSEDFSAGDFQGTGWTALSYQTYIENLLQHKVEHNADLDIKKIQA